MTDKKEFSRLLNHFGSFGFLGTTECEDYGMMRGCDPDCPVFDRGECKDVFIHNIEKFILNKEYYLESAIEVIEIYSDRMTEQEKDELIKLAKENLKL